jgi:indole-3-glycerol phosphate synthase
VLSDDELRSFHALATDIGLDALVEIHDDEELDRALSVGAGLIGVNQRDLRTFQVDQERAVRLAASIPSSAVRVAESGVRGRADAVELRNAGYDAVLVGESIVTSGSPESAVRDLLVP